MSPAKKKRIRSLIGDIAVMVKASLISQAVETEKVIAATFDFSEKFKTLMRNIPPHYIEQVAEQYKNLMFRAFDAGFRKSQNQNVSIEYATEQDLESKIKSVYPMPVALSQDFAKEFENNVGKLLETVVDRSDIYNQFKAELEEAYMEGVKQYVEENKTSKTETDPEVEIQIKKEVTVQEQQPVEAVEIEAPAIATKPETTETEAVAAVSKTELMNKIEEYTKLLGDEESEAILRATMGLPPKPKAVVANVTISKFVGPYDTTDIRAQILELTKSHNLTEGQTQTLTIDCVVNGISDFSSEEQITKAIDAKLGISKAVGSDNYLLSLDEALIAADVLAKELTASLGLPGKLEFQDVNDNLCLVYEFTRKDAADLARVNDTVVTAAQEKLPYGPQGTIPKKDQDEIKAIHKLGKLGEMKEIKKASPKIASYLGQLLTDIRNSKLGIAEGCRALKKDIAAVVEEVFGRDGREYYDYLKGS